MIVVVDGKHYPAASIEDLTLADIMTLQRELTIYDGQLMTRCKTWEDVQGLFTEFQSLPEADRKHHPEIYFYTALLIWASRASSGEKVGLMESVNISPRKIAFIPEPQDHTPGKAKAPKGSPKGSVRGE